MTDGDFRTQSGPAWVVYVLVNQHGHALMEDRGEPIGLVYPGGNIDPTDIDSRHTAERECEEELGVKPKPNEVLALIGGAPITHKGRTGVLYVLTDWTGFVPECTIDEYRRRLVWVNPTVYAGRPTEQTGGFHVGAVAQRLCEWLGVSE